MGRRSKQTILQRQHTDGQKTHEKMFNVTHYQRDANQNHYEVPPYTSQNGLHQHVYKQLSAGEGVERKEPQHTVGGIVDWCNRCGKQYGDASENETQNYHWIQPSHSGASIQRKPCLAKTHVGSSRRGAVVNESDQEP